MICFRIFVDLTPKRCYKSQPQAFRLCLNFPRSFPTKVRERFLKFSLYDFFFQNFKFTIVPYGEMKNIDWGIPSSGGLPYGLADFFLCVCVFFSPSAAENGIPGGQTHVRKPCIYLIF